jgi:hypothetical protein
MSSLLARRKQLLGPTTLSGASIQLLYECATDSLHRLPGQELRSLWHRRPLHARLLRHGPSLSTASMQSLLPPGVLAHMTISMRMANFLLLCTGVGPQRVTRYHLHAITAALALPRQAVKQCTIHPLSYNPAETFALQPGMISPFLHPSRHTDVSEFVLLSWPERWKVQAREVAISLSLWESLVLPLRCLRQTIQSYAKRAYPEVRIIELESEGTFYAYADQRIG